MFTKKYYIIKLNKTVNNCKINGNRLVGGCKIVSLLGRVIEKLKYVVRKASRK
jgi:hypothetical protein